MRKTQPMMKTIRSRNKRGGVSIEVVKWVGLLLIAALASIAAVAQ